MNDDHREATHMETLWSALEGHRMTKRETFRLRGERTIAGEQSLTVEHRRDNPKYVVTYRTYSSHHDEDGRHRVILTWWIVSVFSEKLAFVTELTTYDNDAPPEINYPQALRLKVADRVGEWLLPEHTHRASEAELRTVWIDIKTRERVS
ncbi:MAG TPA: hypothetical protein VFH06_05655 [Candidatus Saccharimonadales bacterium]|nr:hypothetical protein [Candidatus Saccharimonadales bacterium]